MKPDGLSAPDEAMDPSPTEVVAGEKTSSLPGAQEEVTQQTDVSKAQGPEEVAVPPAAQEANSKPVAVAVVLPLESKGKTKAVSTKAASGATKTGASGLNSRPGAASNRTGNEVKTTNNAPAKKTTTVRTQVKVVEKKPVGTARTTPAAASATVANNTRQANGTPKKKLPAGPSNGARPTGPLNGARPTGAFNGARPKTTAPASTTVPKPSISTVPKAEKATGLKTNRTITGTRPPSSTAQSKPTTAPSKPVAVTKPSTSGTGRPARVTTAPSAGRATTTQPPKPNAVAKKDVSRPASATAAKRPAMATSAATKKMEPSKPAPASRPIPASKRPLPLKAAEVKAAEVKAAEVKAAEVKAAEAKAAEAKPTARTKILDSSKPTAAKKTASPGPRPTANNRLPLGRKPLSSPANKSKSQAKDVPKPTLSDTPSAASKEPEALNSSAAVVATVAGVVAAVSSVAESTAMPVTVQGEVEAVGPELPSAAMSGAEKGHSEASAEDSPLASSAADTCLPHSPERTSPDQDLSEITAPLMAATGQILVGAPLFESANQPSTEHPLPPTADQDPSTSNVSLPVATITPLVISSSNLNEVEEEEEEEREGSQQVSESEMSGTTQPTEESRPGSAGPVGGAAWRAGGALLSELDSEEVSGSQQGASELSAPGVLEGTESMDDLGDASLKGAIDMEGASAGSPDILPDIPVNDFEEDEDDDRVCDMDVGSERAEDPQRPRHDNEVEDEDEDVEMASEAVTESGLESYGNADEDDFAEDERLDNLNRVALPPPPPQLPSALAAQWDQPNPFSDPWAQPFEPQQSLQQVAEPLQPSAVGLVPTSPTEPLQADSETPTQSPAQAWLELGTASFVPPNHHSTVPEGPLNSEGQSCMDQFGPVPMHALAPAHLSAPGLSQSSTLSSDTSTPEDLCDFNQEAKLQLHTHAGPAPMLSLQHDPEDQDLGIHLEREDQEEEEAEAETLPADDVLSGPATAPTSNPSSNSTTEDEASDTEGEAQLEVPLRGQDFLNETFEMPPQRQPILSTVEEAEEEATPQSVCGDTTPPSANSAASYGFDTMTTYSNSNAASTGESCNKSPGIFSLEELPEEAMAPCLLQDPQSLPEPPFAAEQHYMQCGNLAEELTENVGMEGPGSEVAFGFTPSTPQQLEDDPDDAKPAYYSAICEKTENSVAGLRALPHPHAAHPRPHCDMVKPLCNSVKPHYDIVKPICDIIKAPSEAATLPRLSCADLPPRNSCAQAVSPQLRRLEQHQRQLLELQQRREQPSRPSCESKEAGEEEVLQGSQKEEDEEEKANEEVNGEEDEETGGEEAGEQEELQEQRRDLQLQLQQQQEELQQRQQIMQWQQELEQQQQAHVGQSAVLLSPSSGLCTIYEALENSEDEAEEKEPVKVLKVELQEQKSDEETQNKDLGSDRERVMSDHNGCDSSTSSQSPPPPDSPRRPSDPQYPHILSPLRDQTLSRPPLQSPERPPPLDLDWGKKVDIVQQLINQTLLLTGDGCSSLLLLPGGAGGTLSPLESSLWPSMLPPLTPPSATVTSVSSFSPEAPGSSPQGEWTVVELETHH